MERKFELLPGAIQVLLGQGEAPEEVIDVLAEAADAARAECLNALLVVSGLGDPATAEAVCRALEKIHAADESPLRIAFVAYMFPQYAAYHFAERYAQKLGMQAKVTVSIFDARNWLGAGVARPGGKERMPMAAHSATAGDRIPS
jgi:hypothetical protein